MGNSLSLGSHRSSIIFGVKRYTRKMKSHCLIEGRSSNVISHSQWLTAFSLAESQRKMIIGSSGLCPCTN